jgi:hypothetical protein
MMVVGERPAAALGGADRVGAALGALCAAPSAQALSAATQARAQASTKLPSAGPGRAGFDCGVMVKVPRLHIGRKQR